MNNKTKNIILLLGFLLMLYLCWQFAFSKTLELKERHAVLTQQQTALKNMPQRLSLLKQKKKQYDSILKKYQLRESSIQNNLLKTLTGFSKNHNLKLVSFLEPHLYKKGKLTIKTYRFTLQGSFNNILGLIYHLEQKKRYGEIINLHFVKKENYRTNYEYLQAEVLLQSFGH